jgi:hypothetical protein
MTSTNVMTHEHERGYCIEIAEDTGEKRKKHTFGVLVVDGLASGNGGFMSCCLRNFSALSSGSSASQQAEHRPRQA